MKKPLMILFFSIWCFGLMAQHESLFGRAQVVGAFGAPIVEMGWNNKLNTAVGGGGGLVINSVFIGAYGMGSVDFEQLLETGEVEKLDLGHGGLWLGFTISPQSLLHLYGSARIGWGAVNISFDDPFLRYQEIDKVFVATPEVGLEMNIARWLRVVGTVGYRYVDGVNPNRGYSTQDFSGAIGSIAVRVGWFGNRRGW